MFPPKVAKCGGNVSVYTQGGMNELKTPSHCHPGPLRTFRPLGEVSQPWGPWGAGVRDACGEDGVGVGSQGSLGTPQPVLPQVCSQEPRQAEGQVQRDTLSAAAPTQWKGVFVA